MYSVLGIALSAAMTVTFGMMMAPSLPFVGSPACGVICMRTLVPSPESDPAHTPGVLTEIGRMRVPPEEDQYAPASSFAMIVRVIVLDPSGAEAVTML